MPGHPWQTGVSGKGVAHRLSGPTAVLGSWSLRDPEQRRTHLSGRMGSPLPSAWLPCAQRVRSCPEILPGSGGHGEGGSGCPGALGPAPMYACAPPSCCPPRPRRCGASSGPCADRTLCFGLWHRPVLVKVLIAPQVYFSLFCWVKNFRFVNQPSASSGCLTLSLLLQKCFFLTKLWNRGH